MVTHYVNDSASADWLKAMADIEHDDPEQAPEYASERIERRLAPSTPTEPQLERVA